MSGRFFACRCLKGVGGDGDGDGFKDGEKKKNDEIE
jgi:hypothetical protein